MTELWYQNPKVLLYNMDQFFPNNNLNRIEKINSLARFAIYYSILILVLEQNNKLLAIGITILTISFFLGNSEGFTTTDKTIDPNSCQPPTKNNPFMNFTISDLIDNKNRNGACSDTKSKDLMRTKFRSQLYSDSSDLWGQFISDRNFYTMPNTEIVNKQSDFARWCFGNSGECKTTGQNCLKERDPRYHRGRLTTIDNVDYK